MRLLRALWFRLRALVQRDAMNAEFDDELRHHIARETEANIRRGCSPAEARQRALAEFGGVERFKEDLRDERSVRWLEDIASDVRHGLRLIRTNLLFSSAVIGTLALGIGATSTIFAVVNGVLLQKASYPHPEQVISISQTRKGADAVVASNTNYLAWMQSQRTLSSIALYGGAPLVLTGAGEPRALNGNRVTSSYFTVLAARPALGRLLQPDDAREGAPPVVVLSHALWQNTFGGDSAIVGHSITLSDIPRRVVGVMPRDFDNLRKTEFWLPLRLDGIPANLEVYFRAIARVRDGISLSAVQRELDAIAVRRDSTRPEAQRGDHVTVMTMHDRQFGSVKKPLTFLLGAVAMLLLIACLNVANLTLARSAARRREFSVRLALGASSWRLARQLFVESTLLTVAGGVIGAVIPVALVSVFVRLSGDSLAGVTDIRVNGAVLAFTAIATMVVALLFGVAPSLTGSRSGPATSLAADSTRTSGARKHGVLRSTLVVVEIAAALTLLTGAGLLSKSFVRALAISPGFRPENVYAAYTQLTGARYESADGGETFYNEMVAGLRALPGVQEVAQANGLPLRGFSYSREINRMSGDGTKLNVAVTSVSAEFATAIGLQLLKGRFINERDRTGTEPVAMVTESFARAMFPGQDPVGNTIPAFFGDQSKPDPVIVGVISEIPQMKIEDTALPAVFLPSAQGGKAVSYLVIRSTLDEAVLRDALKRIITRLNPNQPLTEFFSMSGELSKAYAPRRFNSALINAFAGLALLLAVIGLYGLMAHSVIARTRELGIRIALGARTDNVMRLVLRQGLVLTAIGVACGVILSLALARTLSGLLYDVTTHDPFVFVAAPLALAVVALAACYVPARRATRVDPMVALRQE